MASPSNIPLGFVACPDPEVPVPVWARGTGTTNLPLTSVGARQISLNDRQVILPTNTGNTGESVVSYCVNRWVPPAVNGWGRVEVAGQTAAGPITLCIALGWNSNSQLVEFALPSTNATCLADPRANGIAPTVVAGWSTTAGAQRSQTCGGAQFLAIMPYGLQGFGPATAPDPTCGSAADPVRCALERSSRVCGFQSDSRFCTTFGGKVWQQWCAVNWVFKYADNTTMSGGVYQIQTGAPVVELVRRRSRQLALVPPSSDASSGCSWTRITAGGTLQFLGKASAPASCPAGSSWDAANDYTQGVSQLDLTSSYTLASYTPPPPPAPPGGLSAGAAAGIAIAVILIVAIIIACFLLYRTRGTGGSGVTGSGRWAYGSNSGGAGGPVSSKARSVQRQSYRAGAAGSSGRSASSFFGAPPTAAPTHVVPSPLAVVGGGYRAGPVGGAPVVPGTVV